MSANETGREVEAYQITYDGGRYRAICRACFLECDGRGKSANEAIKHIMATGCDIESREHSMRRQGRPVS